jgi:hypothetical protein
VNKILEDKAVEMWKHIYEWIIAHGPAWFVPASKVIGFIVLLLFTIYLGIEAFMKVRKALQELLPRFSEKERARHKHRVRLCTLIQSQIEKWNKNDLRVQFSDDEFTDLEAEVEAEGRQRFTHVLAWLLRQRSGSRREKSLTKAIKNSRERIVILEGPAGSGKTVALRHVALLLAKEASASNSNLHPIGLYINLKSLARGDKDEIGVPLIEAHVQKQLNESNDPALQDFLKDELKQGRDDGSLIFFFDSFDEIPEILNATDADETIRAYGRAIDGFIGAIGESRGIVASRAFRGPKRLGWPVFRILPLTTELQADCIQRLKLPPHVETQLIGNLPTARLELQAIAENPLFLRLLCNYVKTKAEFPNNVFEIFETFVTTRFATEAERIRPFNVEPAELRAFAEQTAFIMNHSQTIGLSPMVSDLAPAIAQELRDDEKDIVQKLEALAAAGFATMPEEAGARRFSFGHRRLQEYFSTAIVLREPDRVPAASLLADGRWRETTVTLLQTQEPAKLEPLLLRATEMLAAMRASLPEQSKEIDWFPWPDGSLHLLSLLQDGVGSRRELLSEVLSEHATEIVASAYASGTLLDQKWTVESASPIRASELERLLQLAISSRFDILRDVAYRQAARLIQLPEEMVAFVRTLIMRASVASQSHSARAAMQTHLRRLPDAQSFVNLSKLLRVAAVMDRVLFGWLVVVWAASMAYPGADRNVLLAATGGLMLVVLLRIFAIADISASFHKRWVTRLRWRYSIAFFSAFYAFALIENINEKHPRISVTWILLIALFAFYADTAFSGAISAPVNGRWYLLPFRWLKWWAVIQVPATAVSDARKKIRDFFTVGDSVKGRLKRFLIIAGKVVLFAIVMMLFSGLSAVWDWAKSTPGTFPKIVRYAAMGIGTLLGLMVILGLISISAEVGGGWLIGQWKVMRCLRNKTITPDQFLVTLVSLRSGKQAAGYIRTVRVDCKLESSTASLQIASYLLLSLQGKPPENPAIEAFVLRHMKTDQVISELARLVEQVSPAARD